MNEHITCICGWRAQVNQPLPFLFYPFLAFSATVLGSWVRAKGPLVCPPALLVPIPALNDVWPAQPTRRHASRRFQSVPRVQQMWAEKSQAQDSEVFEGLTFPTITLCRPKSSKSLQHRFTSTACNILDKQSGKSQASRMILKKTFPLSCSEGCRPSSNDREKGNEGCVIMCYHPQRRTQQRWPCLDERGQKSARIRHVTMQGKHCGL